MIDVSAGGNGQKFTIDVHYDTGCSSMAIPFSDITVMMTTYGLNNLSKVRTRTASGQGMAQIVSLLTRVLDRHAEKELLAWHETCCHIYHNIGTRIFRSNLESSCFTCTHPSLQRLYVAHSKRQLCLRMPKA